MSNWSLSPSAAEMALLGNVFFCSGKSVLNLVPLSLSPKQEIKLLFLALGGKKTDYIYIFFFMNLQLSIRIYPSLHSSTLHPILRHRLSSLVEKIRLTSSPCIRARLRWIGNQYAFAAASDAHLRALRPRVGA